MGCLNMLERKFGILCMFLGGVCFLYFFTVAFFLVHGTNFYFIWFVLGLFFTLSGVFLFRGCYHKLRKEFRHIIEIFLSFVFFIFLFIELMIFTQFHAYPHHELDYLIVLGAQVTVNGPSPVLKMRLDTAYEYLIEHKDTKVIVSGGQGGDEPFSEAHGMYQYLVEKGIDSSRIVMEDQSRNTKQNIENSIDFIDTDEDYVGVVTNNFHVFRATKLAKNMGLNQVFGVSAPSYLSMLPNNLLREFFGVSKDFLFGNL